MQKEIPPTQTSAIPPIYGDPIYEAEDDIYTRSKKIEPGAEVDDMGDTMDEEINPGADLDVPGTEMDDADERNGSEDEENNYYSIGGDNHNDLEEDKDEQ